MVRRVSAQPALATVLTASALVAAASAALFATGAKIAGAATAPIPDSACEKEPSFRSTRGDVKASLLVINNTGETLQALWLDYDGMRVFYQQIPPFTSNVVQATWLTHPWIIANLQGACYRLLVMTAQQQTVTVNPGDGPPTRTAPPPESTLPPRSSPGKSSGEASGKETGEENGSGFPTVPVVGGLVALAGLFAALAASGHLPGFSGRGSSAKGSAADGPHTGMSGGTAPDALARAQALADNIQDFTSRVGPMASDMLAGGAQGTGAPTKPESSVSASDPQGSDD